LARARRALSMPRHTDSPARWRDGRRTRRGERRRGPGPLGAARGLREAAREASEGRCQRAACGRRRGSTMPS
jgi:hypothetical protein